jgi:hypothetical protein
MVSRRIVSESERERHCGLPWMVTSVIAFRRGVNKPSCPTSEPGKTDTTDEHLPLERVWHLRFPY